MGRNTGQVKATANRKKEIYMRELISVIIPAFNAEKTIKKCVESVLEQTYKEIEVIVIDDGSIDSTFHIVKNIPNERLRVFRTKNQGVSSARNYGMKMARGKYIGFVDSDDYIKPQMYEKMVGAIDNVEAVICNHLNWNNKECEATMFYEMGTRSSTQVMKDIFEKKIGGNVWRFLFYKRIIDEYKISFPNLKMSEDMIFIMDYLNACKSVNVISDKCYVYNQINENSAVKNMGNEKYLEDFIEFPSKLKNIFEKYKKYDQFKGYIAKEHVITAMSIRLMKKYKIFKNICKEERFRKALDSTAVSCIKDQKYRLYYWGLLNNNFWVCNVGYYFNGWKTRIINYNRQHLHKELNK